MIERRQLCQWLSLLLVGWWSGFVRNMKKNCDFENVITPNIRNVIDTTMQDARMCTTTYTGDGEFRAKDGFTNFAVNLRTRTCDRGYWGISGLPASMHVHVLLTRGLMWRCFVMVLTLLKLIVYVTMRSYISCLK